MEELDFSNADPADLAEYTEITEQIESLGPEDREELRRLLKRRAKVMSRILKSNVYSVVD